MKVLMVAAENDALPGFKVGGIGDVVRDVPTALAAADVDVEVVVPDYFNCHTSLASQQVNELTVSFAGQQQQIGVYRVINTDKRITQWLFVHPLFSANNSVYSNDPSDRPFATDATKYALFNRCVCEWLLQREGDRPEVLHLHDWHAATVATLIAFEDKYQPLNPIHRVFSVHNIALQGIRPLKHDPSSLENWFPELSYDGQQLCDPRYRDCYNPVAAAIHLCHKIHLVSPTYAEEVLLPSDPQQLRFGGEGMESILNQHRDKLVGILNGCDYQKPLPPKLTMQGLLKDITFHVRQWMAHAMTMSTVQYLADQTIQTWLQTPPSGAVFTSIGRLTDQKVYLLRQPSTGGTVLDRVLTELAEHQGVLILMGSGDPQIELEMTQHMARHPNFLFINGYSVALSDALYQLGDVFLMPSAFEPCGISQMLAMRAGQPCLVHGVGGLKDTVIDGVDGFQFNGDTIGEQADNLMLTLARVLAAKQTEGWSTICANAAEARFYWADSIKQYLNQLYR